jgi:hypothetical protein
MKTVYILGAGFSRAAGLPLMNDFYLTSKDIYSKLDPISKKSFDKIYRFWDEYSSAKHYLTIDFFNIEELLSIIEMHNFLNGNKKLSSDLILFIKKVIELKTPDILSDKEKYEVYERFIKNIFGIYEDQGFASKTKEQDNSIISLNYDLLIENVLEKYNRYNENNMMKVFNIYRNFYIDYGENISPVNFFINNNFKTIISLAKIHGSINFENNLIIPPTWNKTNHPRISGIWKLAYRLLMEANNIYFIGYSLPITDNYIKYLLVNAIKESTNLKTIKIINPDDNQNTVQKRYEDFFDKNLKVNGMISFESKKFEDWVNENFPLQPKKRDAFWP